MPASLYLLCGAHAQVTAALSAGVFYVLYAHSPNVDHLKEEAQRAHESLIDYLVGRGPGGLVREWSVGAVSLGGKLGMWDLRDEGRRDTWL